ncbi:MAG: transposase [Isosphaeraceae bacterium]
MRKPRKNDTPVDKAAIFRRHLIDHVPVSDLGDEHRLSPTLFYLWQKQFFENGPAVFERKNDTPDSRLQRTIAALRDKLQPGQRAQRSGPSRLAAQSVGADGHPRIPPGPPLEGYRRLAFMMLDADVVAARCPFRKSPTSSRRCQARTYGFHGWWRIYETDI